VRALSEGWPEEAGGTRHCHLHQTEPLRQALTNPDAFIPSPQHRTDTARHMLSSSRYRCPASGFPRPVFSGTRVTLYLLLTSLPSFFSLSLSVSSGRLGDPTQARQRGPWTHHHRTSGRLILWAPPPPPPLLQQRWRLVGVLSRFSPRFFFRSVCPVSWPAHQTSGGRPRPSRSSRSSPHGKKQLCTRPAKFSCMQALFSFPYCVFFFCYSSALHYRLDGKVNSSPMPAERREARQAKPRCNPTPVWIPEIAQPDCKAGVALRALAGLLCVACQP
jgi:hypothetical protein